MHARHTGTTRRQSSPTEVWARSRLGSLPAVVIASSVDRWAAAYAPEKYVPYATADVDKRRQASKHSLARRRTAPLPVSRDAGCYVHPRSTGYLASESRHHPDSDKMRNADER